VAYIYVLVAIISDTSIMTLNKIIQLLCLTQLAFFNATAQEQTTNKKFRLLTYGLQDDTRRNAKGIIENKWSIQFYPVAGCIIDRKLEDSVKKENDKIYKLIEIEYGKDWEDKFFAEVEEEYKIEAQIDSFIKKQSFIESKEIINPLPGTPFPMYPVDNDGNYIVTVSTYNRAWEEQKLYKLKVNYKKSTIKIIVDYTSK